MRPRVVSYIFRSWLTSVLLGPILLVLGVNFVFWVRYSVYGARSVFGGQTVSWPTLQEMAVFYALGTAAMIPTFFLLWLGCYFVCRRIWPVRMRKLAMTLWALVLIAVTSNVLNMFMRWGWQPVNMLGGSFFLPMLGGILFYRFPEPKGDPVFDF
jgi:hypothetical protein